MKAVQCAGQPYWRGVVLEDDAGYPENRYASDVNKDCRSTLLSWSYTRTAPG